MMTVLAVSVSPQLTHAQAVNTINGNIAGAGGYLTGSGGGLAIGRFDTPVTPDTGFQLDPFGGFGGHDFWGIGGNFFTRNTTLGSLGVIASVEGTRGANLQHYGAQGEYYAGPVDFALRAGYQTGDQVNHGGFVELHAGLYVTDDFQVGTASLYDAGRFTQAFDAEYLPHWQPLPNMSLFALAEVGGPGGTMGIAGVRFHLGDDNSLRDRHHQQNVYFPIEPF